MDANLPLFYATMNLFGDPLADVWILAAQFGVLTILEVGTNSPSFHSVISHICGEAAYRGRDNVVVWALARGFPFDDAADRAMLGHQEHTAFLIRNWGKRVPPAQRVM